MAELGLEIINFIEKKRFGTLQNAEKVEEAYNKVLDDKERNILYKRAVEGKRATELGKVYCVCRERIRQYENRAIKKIIRFVKPPIQIQDDTPITLLGLTTRAEHQLMLNNVLTVSDLLNKTAEEILEMRAIGKSTFANIVTVLGSYKLNLRSELGWERT